MAITVLCNIYVINDRRVKIFFILPLALYLYSVILEAHPKLEITGRSDEGACPRQRRRNE